MVTALLATAAVIAIGTWLRWVSSPTAIPVRGRRTLEQLLAEPPEISVRGTRTLEQLLAEPPETSAQAHERTPARLSRAPGNIRPWRTARVPFAQMW